jgi:hypothetical protein
MPSPGRTAIWKAVLADIDIPGFSRWCCEGGGGNEYVCVPARK